MLINGFNPSTEEPEIRDIPIESAETLIKWSEGNRDKPLQEVFPRLSSEDIRFLLYSIGEKDAR